MRMLLTGLLLVGAVTTATAGEEITTKTTEYQCGARTMRGYLAMPADADGSLPGVLVVHEWMGLNDYARRRAEQLARLGYVALAADMYGDGKVAADTAEAASLSGALKKGSRTDLRDVAAIEAMVARVHQELGPPDILVNNAVVRHFKPVEDFSAAEWDMSLAVNVSAPFHLVRLLSAGMKRQGWGRIVNLSSIYGQRGVANRIDYVTSKTAIPSAAGLMWCPSHGRPEPCLARPRPWRARCRCDC